MAKDWKWSRWGRGSCEGYGLKFGYGVGSIIANVVRNVGDPVTWRASINSRGYGNYPDKESAMAHLEMEIRSGVKMLLEDWNRLNVSGRQ